jgi:hypothetical protein
MSLSDFLEKFGRTVFEAPLGSFRAGREDLKEPPELAEIRLAVLDQVREQSYRSGGRKVFPYDLIRIHMRGVEESRVDVYTGSFFRRYLEQEVAGSLREAGCRFPDHLRLEVSAEMGLPPRGEPWLTVEVAAQSPAAPAVKPAARLVVQEGKANAAVIRLDKACVNIGRVVDVYRDQGIHRRNDLAFADETEVNRTVSREHAHIKFDRTTGEYRVFNDRWQARGKTGECGTWIVRDGMSHEVHRDSRGVKLEPGDEIHFGRAVVIFETE